MKTCYSVLTFISICIFSNHLCLADNPPNTDPAFALTREQFINKSPEEAKNIVYFALLKFGKEKEQYYLKKYRITSANSPFNMQRFEESMKKKVYSAKSVNELNLFVLSEDISKRIAELFQPLALLKDYDSLLISETKALEKNFSELKSEIAQILVEQKKITSVLNTDTADNNPLSYLKNKALYINLSILGLQIILLFVTIKNKL